MQFAHSPVNTPFSPAHTSDMKYHMSHKLSTCFVTAIFLYFRSHAKEAMVTKDKINFVD